jgi:phosphatidylserine/phosphatidylglycerophosphate/cardiolipin synthase-like enzyme
MLKALGAFRLLRHFKGDWKAAADYSEPFCRDRRGNPKPLYVEQSEWRDAEKKAAIALTEFHSKVFTRKVFG